MNLEDPEIGWSADGPTSGRFGDVYFSRDDGAAESRHVFLDGCSLPDAWVGRQRFVIGETGFGTGLNVLCAWDLWRRDPRRPVFLDIVSVEGFPMEADAAARALSAFPELAPLAAELIAAWPVAQPGAHLLTFEGGRVRLLLLLGEAAAMLSRLQARVDAWFLDGFAPSRNPEMWRPAVLAQVARLAAPDARLATFSVAGTVRRGLEEHGFRVSKRPGFGRKRDCLQAVYAGPRGRDALPPWFTPPHPVPAGARIAVIGGGVAGAAMAGALRAQGFAPVIVERHGRLAAEASGNPCGLLKPRLTADGGLHGRFYALAYLHALRRLPPETWVGRGILTVARDDAEAGRIGRLAGTLAGGHATAVDAAEARALAGIEAPRGGLWQAFAGSIRPPQVCEALAAGAELVAGTVAGLDRTAAGWHLRGTAIEAEAVVVAAGPLVPRLLPDADLPIRANRGQISLLPADDGGAAAALSFGGYLSPRFDGLRVLGATYGRWPDPADDSWSVLKQADHDHVLELMAEHLPGVPRPAPVGGRASLRATIADHMPMAGPAFDAAVFRESFSALRHGPKAVSAVAAPWMPGVYVLGALGSRGFQTAPLLADLLAAQMSGAPLPLESDLLALIHPARFVVRGLRKSQAGRPLRSGAPNQTA